MGLNDENTDQNDDNDDQTNGSNVCTHVIVLSLRVAAILRRQLWSGSPEIGFELRQWRGGFDRQPGL
jgi:hypothetical protein